MKYFHLHLCVCVRAYVSLWRESSGRQQADSRRASFHNCVRTFMHSDTQLFCIVCELLCIVIKLFCIGFELSVGISSALRLTSATSPHVLYICSSSQLNESMMYWVQFYLMCCSPEATPCGLLMWSYSRGGEQLLFVALKVMHNTSSVWATYEGKVRFQAFVSSLTS